jgi:hypothetical protein
MIAMTRVNSSEEPRPGAAIGLFFAGCLIILVIPMACFCGWCYYYMESLPVAQSKMDRIHPGMKKEDVRAILGPPKWVSSAAGQEYQWKYGHESQWQMFEVRFDNSGNIAETHLDR